MSLVNPALTIDNQILTKAVYMDPAFSNWFSPNVISNAVYIRMQVEDVRLEGRDAHLAIENASQGNGKNRRGCDR